MQPSDVDWIGEEPDPADAAKAAPLLRLADLLRNPAMLAPPPAVAERLVWEGRTTLIACPEKGGKSTIAGQLAAAMQSGDPFLGRAPASGTVVWLALDEPLADTARRLRDFRALDGVYLRTRLDSMQQLRDDLEISDAKLLVIDTLAEFARPFVEDFNNAAAWIPLLRQLREIVAESGCGCLLLHHTTRDGTRYADSRQIGAGVDCIAELVKADEGRAKLAVRGRVNGHETLSLYWAGDRYIQDGGTLTLDARVIAAVQTQPGLSFNKLCDHLQARRSDVLAALRRAEKAGVVRNEGDDKRSRWTATTQPQTGTGRNWLGTEPELLTELVRESCPGTGPGTSKGGNWSGTGPELLTETVAK